MAMTFGAIPSMTLSSPFKSGKTLDDKLRAQSGQQGQSQSQSSGSSQSQTYYSNPGLVGQTSNALGNLQTNAANNYMNVVNNPAGSQAYQNSLVGALAALHPSEQGARRSLADQFRAAGNLASSSYAKGAAGLESGLMRNRMELASDLMAKLYPSITQASYAPISQTSSLIDALKLQNASSQQQAQSYSVDQGGGTGGGGFIQGAPSGANMYNAWNSRMYAG